MTRIRPRQDRGLDCIDPFLALAGRPPSNCAHPARQSRTAAGVQLIEPGPAVTAWPYYNTTARGTG